MGYRSDVGIALGFETKEECDAFITAYKIKEPEFWKNEVVGFWGRPEPRVLTAQYDYVKWYRNYEDVNAIHDMLEWADENHGAVYKVIRVGEEIEDIGCDEDCMGNDVHTCLEDYVYLERRVGVTSGQPLD